MTADLLIEHFETLAATPGGVPKLRELILSLAVRGKLVPNDPASGTTNSEISNPPHPIPASWRWVALDSAVDFDCASKVAPAAIKNNDWVLDLEDIEKDTSRLITRAKASDRQSKSTKASFAAGDVLYGKLRPYLNKVLVADAPGFCTTEILPLRPSSGVTSQFVRRALMSPDFIAFVNAKSYGMKMPRLGTDDARSAPFPLPPLPEQQRIVAKVDELMQRCDELEARQEAARKTQLDLTRSALHHLTSTPPADFSNAWNFIRENFPSLAARPENVPDLRKAILQLAVMGKLVPQDSSEICHLESQIPPDKQPFAVPPNWSWCRLASLSKAVHYGYTASAAPARIDPKMLRITDIQDDRVNWETVPGCEIDEAIIGKYALSNGDMLIARTGGTIGKTYLVENLSVRAVFASYLIRVVPDSAILPAYLKVFAGSETYWTQLYAGSMGTGQPNVNGTTLSALLVPLPPLAEQRRIVAKVEGLMKLCDALEAGLTRERSEADRLFEAVVARLLAA